MMGQNSKSGGRRASFRLSEEEAFELCHPDVREALRSCVFSWSTAGALNYQRKHGSAATVAWLRDGDMTAIRRQGWTKGVKSPCISHRVKPLYAAATL